MSIQKEHAEARGKITENKLAVFREFAAEIGCDIVIEKNLPQSLDVGLKRNFAGIYIQLRKRGDIYIGEAIDILDRQKEHLAKGVNLAALAVLWVGMSNAQERKEIETAVIAAAQKKGLRLANISKIKLAEELDRKVEQLSMNAVLDHLDGCDRKAVMEFGIGGWLESLEEARAKATDSDWERYANFKASSLSYAAMHAISTFVRRTIQEPEANYGRTWCICINETGYPGPEWLCIKTQAGKVFEIDVVQSSDDTVLRARLWVERLRLDLFTEFCELDDQIMRMNLGITQGVFDLKRSYIDLQDRTSMRTRLFYQRTPKQVAWEMDSEQALELLQSRWGVALTCGCVESVSGKMTGEGFRLGRLLF